MSDVEDQAVPPEHAAPVSRLAQLREIPIGQRGRVRWQDAGRARDGRSGADVFLDALDGSRLPVPAAVAVAEPAPEVVAGPRPATSPVAVPAMQAVEADWLMAAGSRELHHAVLDIHQLTELTDDELVDARTHPVRLSCGQVVTTSVSAPSIGSRRGALRCAACCRQLGYPGGTGSPRNDSGCRRALTARIERLP